MRYHLSKIISIIILIISISSCRNEVSKNKASKKGVNTIKVVHNKKLMPFNDEYGLGYYINEFYREASRNNSIGDIERNVYIMSTYSNEDCLSCIFEVVQTYYYETEDLSTIYKYDNSLFVFIGEIHENIYKKLGIDEGSNSNLLKGYKSKDSVPIMPFNPDFIKIKLNNDGSVEVLDKKT